MAFADMALEIRGGDSGKRLLMDGEDGQAAIGVRSRGIRDFHDS